MSDENSNQLPPQMPQDGSGSPVSQFQVQGIGKGIEMASVTKFSDKGYSKLFRNFFDGCLQKGD